MTIGSSPIVLSRYSINPRRMDIPSSWMILANSMTADFTPSISPLILPVQSMANITSTDNAGRAISRDSPSMVSPRHGTVFGISSDSLGSGSDVIVGFRHGTVSAVMLDHRTISSSNPNCRNNVIPSMNHLWNRLSMSD